MPGFDVASTLRAPRAFPSLKRGLALVGLAAVALGLGLLKTRPVSAEPQGTVFVNGIPSPVYFNDGDTFRVLAGPLRGMKARLGGFNTLESFGPVHSWGAWDPKELYVNAKQATYSARRGAWHCDADLNQRDGYGRVLAVCLDLGEDHLARGLAHAYSVGGPGHPRLLRAQHRAIVEKRGMWAKGVPSYIVTSVHSVDERLNNKNNYNRLISTLDGLSFKWKHQDRYSNCQKVCFREQRLKRARALDIINRLRSDAATNKLLRGWSDVLLVLLLNEYVMRDRVAQIFTAAEQVTLKAALDKLRQDGHFKDTEEVEGACMVYVPWQLHYGRNKSSCLKWHH